MKRIRSEPRRRASQKSRTERDQARDAAAQAATVHRQQKTHIDAYFNERLVWNTFRLERERATFEHTEACDKFRALCVAAAIGRGSHASSLSHPSRTSTPESEMGLLYLDGATSAVAVALFAQWRFVVESDMRRTLLVPRLAVYRRPELDAVLVDRRPVAAVASLLPISVWTVDVARHLSLRECTVLASTCRQLQHVHRTRLEDAAHSVLPRLTRICEWWPHRPWATGTIRSPGAAAGKPKVTIAGTVGVGVGGGVGDAGNIGDAKAAPLQQLDEKTPRRSVRETHPCHPAFRTPEIRARYEAECAVRTARHAECRCTNYYMLPHFLARERNKHRLLRPPPPIHPATTTPSPLRSPSPSPLSPPPPPLPLPPPPLLPLPPPRFVLVGTDAVHMRTGYVDEATAKVCRCHSHGPNGYASNSVLARYQSAECYHAGTFGCSAVRLLASTARKPHDPAQTLVRVFVYCRRLRVVAKMTATPECERDLEAWLVSVGIDACFS